MCLITEVTRSWPAGPDLATPGPLEGGEGLVGALPLVLSRCPKDLHGESQEIKYL